MIGIRVRVLTQNKHHRFPRELRHDWQIFLWLWHGVRARGADLAAVGVTPADAPPRRKSNSAEVSCPCWMNMDEPL